MNNQEHPQSTILVIDDDPTNLSVLLEYLGEMHYNILVAQNGESALEQLQYALPDLILLDVMMPGMDGFETCRRLKANVRFRDIPVIFMTALTDTDHKIRGFDVGGVDYVTKPLEYQEILARIHTHLTIRSQQKQLQDLNASKNTFFSVIAHDLRGPVNSLSLLNQLAETKIDTDNPARLKEIITLQQHAIDNLCNLLENLLTWASMQQGLIACHPQQIPVAELVARNLDLLTPTARQKQITFSSAIPPQVSIYADLNMVDAVVRNLLSNAVKFTHPCGAVEVCASQNETSVEVSVMDTGIGIPEEKIASLFQLDTKYKRTGTAGEKGTGLGLILCKDLVERNGGTLRVESQVGQGSRVIITLPAGV